MRRNLGLLVLFVSTSASAEPTPTPAAPPATYDVGVRIGGYGFRREGDNNPSTAWNECQMAGVGVFGSRAMRGPLFVEAALDMYSSSDLRPEGTENDLPVSRTSGLASAAIGARAILASRLRGFVQLGAGVELTRVSVPYADQMIRANKVMPEGFFGVGIDLRLTRSTYFGAQFRAHVMGNFDYDSERLGSNWTMPTADEVFDASPDAAAQGQFYFRHDL
jgi:hypothetical protein